MRKTAAPDTARLFVLLPEQASLSAWAHYTQESSQGEEKAKQRRWTFRYSQRRFWRTLPAMETAEQKRRWLTDRMLLWIAGIVTAAVGVAAFAIADQYEIEEFWLRLGFSLVAFLAAAISPVRPLLRRRFFVAYLGAWSVIHVAMIFVFLSEEGVLLWGLAMLPELFVFFAGAFIIFGPLDEAGEKASRTLSQQL
jgi:hypothetical protein